MTFLEAIIMKLTRETASGGTCRLGDASITVKYSTDIWEWEYGGRTFWDVQDLAEAIIQDSRASPTTLLAPAKKNRTVRDTLKDNYSPDGFFMEPPEEPWGQAL